MTMSAGKLLTGATSENEYLAKLVNSTVKRGNVADLV